MVCMYTITNLPYCLYTFHKTNMLLLCYMMLFVPKSSIFFSMSCDCMTYDCDICDHSVTGAMSLLCFVTYMIIIYNIILHFLFKFKIKKMKRKWKKKNQN